MKVITAKSVRFTQVVAQSGTPEPLTLWSNPAKDPQLQKTLDQKRLMTVKQSNVGTKADFGLIGYFPGGPSSFLLFPKTLAPFDGLRVVGIKYDLIRSAPPSHPSVSAAGSEPRKHRNPAAPKPAPAPAALKHFSITVECTVRMDTIQDIDAKSKSEAARKAIRQATDNPPDFRSGKIQCRVKKVLGSFSPGSRQRDR